MTTKWDPIIKLLKGVGWKGKTTKELLIFLYCTKHYGTNKIATICDCSRTTIINQLNKYHVKLRKRGGPNRTPVVFVSEQDYKALSLKEIAAKYHIHIGTAARKIRPYKKKGD